MSSPIGHGLGAYALLVSIKPELAQPENQIKTILAATFFGSLADADFFVAPFTSNPVWGHHYFSHSIFFAVLFTLVCCLVAKAFKADHPWKAGGLFGAAYGSHLIIDYFTSDGSPPYGIPLFWPFTHQHYVAPVELFISIHRGNIQTLFGANNWIAMGREILILLPIALIAYTFARKSRKIAELQTGN